MIFLRTKEIKETNKDLSLKVLFFNKNDTSFAIGLMASKLIQIIFPIFLNVVHFNALKIISEICFIKASLINIESKEFKK